MGIMDQKDFLSILRQLNLDNEDEITSALKEKYGLEFGVKLIGNRLASDRMDTVTAYCFPKNDERIVFKVVMTFMKEIIEEDYILRSAEVKAERLIEKELKEHGIEGSVLISFAGVDPKTVQPDGDIVEIIAENSNVLISFPTVICGDGDAGRVYDAVKEAMDSLTGGKKGISAGTTVWCYERPEYEKCLSVLRSRSFVTKTELQRFSPKYYGAISFKGGVINVNRDDFIREAGK